jgi:hypothetical protein
LSFLSFLFNSDLPIAEREEEWRAFFEEEYAVLITTRSWLQRSVFFHLNED